MGDKASNHWITRYLNERKMTEMHLVMLYRMTYNKSISDMLIFILEGGGVTHPAIARRIVELCDKGAEEFDAIVNKEHRGTYTVVGAKKKVKPEAKVRDDSHDILMINEHGEVVKVFTSYNAAAAEGWTKASTIASICKGQQKDDFRLYPVTWRWRCMLDEAERRRIIDIATLAKNEVMSFKHPRLRDRVELDGVTKTIAEWASMYQISYDRLRWRLENGVEFRKALELKVGRKKECEE